MAIYVVDTAGYRMSSLFGNSCYRFVYAVDLLAYFVLGVPNATET